VSKTNKKASRKKIVNNKKANKAVVGNSGTQQDFMTNPFGMKRDIAQDRGMTVYNLHEIMNITGRDKHGQLVSWGSQLPMFKLSIRQRNEIFKLCDPVFGVVSSRMKRMAGLDFNIVPIKDREDEIVQGLKSIKSIYDDYTGQLEMKYIVARAKAVQAITKFMPDVLPDLSNFNNALMRMKRKIQIKNKHSGEEVKEWLMQPTQGVTWADYVQKFVYDLMIHGAEGTYKKLNDDGLLEDFDSLVGGSIHPLASKSFSTFKGYVQIITGDEAQIFFSDELSYSEYLPTSTQHYPFIPLEALINKIIEYLMFDGKMASEADGTKPPEKLIIVTKNAGLTSGFDPEIEEVPLDTDEQKRIETKVTQPQKNAVITFSGNGVEVVDLSTSNTMQLQTDRQSGFIKALARVYNMSNMEINETGSDGTSGRNTSDSQADIEEGKGIAPMKRLISEKITNDIIPWRFGFGMMMEYESGKNPLQDVELTLKRQQAGLETVNESREKEGSPVIPDEQFDKPISAAGGLGQPDGTELNPLNIKSLNGGK
jgi:hypothetical protein